MEFYFYLSSIINNNINYINYSYDFDLVKDIYNRMTEERQIRKFILYILAYPIIYNYKGSDESNSLDKLDKILIEIDKFIKNQQPILRKYNLNLDLDNYDLFNIDDIYCQFILSLIKNEKLKNFKEAKDIMEQLDLENIELTHDMYIILKKEFDENSNKKYLAQYKIIYSENIKDIINKDLINFYYLLLKYIFKNTIYIYNIDFLLESKKSLYKIVKNYYEKLFFVIYNNKIGEYQKKINFVLKQFLDSCYNYIDKVNKKKFMKEIYRYYKNYCFESKKFDILKINDFLNNNKKLDEINDYIQDYDLAKKMNILFPLIKFLFDYNEKNRNAEAELNSYIKEINEIQKKLLGKKELDDNIKIKLFKFFDTEKKENEFSQIFNKDAFYFFKEKKKEAVNEILNYYKDFFPESKNNDIVNFEDYLKAKKINERKSFIFLLIDGQKNHNESGIQRAIEKWNQIEKNFNDKNFQNIEEEDKQILFKLFKEPKNELINRIFNNELIEVFIDEEESRKMTEISNYTETTNTSTIVNQNSFFQPVVNEIQRRNQNINTNLQKKIEKNQKDNLSKPQRPSETKNKNEIIIKKKKIDNKYDKIWRIVKKNNLKFYMERNNDDESDEESCIKIEHTSEEKCIIYKYDFYFCKDYFKKRCYKNKESKEIKKFIIFDFLTDIQDTLINKYKNNYKFKIEIKIEILNKMCKYKIYKVNEPECIHEETINISLGGVKKIIDKINDLFKNEIEKNEKYNAITNIKLYHNEDDYRILSFIKVIGDHNEIGGTYTAELIKELNHGDFNYISLGSDKTLRMYSGSFYEKPEIRINSNDIIYNVFQKSDKNLQLLACTNKEIILYKKEDNVFKDSPLPINDDYMSYISLIQIKNGEKDMIIIAGKGGILCINNLFNKNIKYEKVKIMNDCEYRGLIQIDENLIAFTSNKTLSRGENILVIYDLSNNNIIYRKKASYITTTNGLSVLSPATEGDSTNEKREKYLICACKKYEEDQENGIMVIRIKDNKIIDEDSIFIPTKDFEVYCFCQIFDKIMNKELEINQLKYNCPSNQELCKYTDFFLVGGYDNIRREGLIKLYKLNKEGKGIKFLQDIEFEKYD